MNVRPEEASGFVCFAALAAPIGIFEVALLRLHRACPGGAATDSYMACLFLACSPPGLSRWKQRLAAMLCDIAVNRAPTGTGPVESGNHRERAVAASRRPTGTGPVEAGKRNFKDWDRWHGRRNANRVVSYNPDFRQDPNSVPQQIRREFSSGDYHGMIVRKSFFVCFDAHRLKVV